LSELAFVESILPVYTNILIFNLKKEMMSGDAFEKKLKEQGIKVSSFGKQTIRFVTHLDFTDEMCGRTIAALRSVF
jgi:threonine aldolase